MSSSFCNAISGIRSGSGSMRTFGRSVSCRSRSTISSSNRSTSSSSSSRSSSSSSSSSRMTGRSLLLLEAVGVVGAAVV